MKHDEYVYVDFILNDMDHEYNNGYDNDWDVDKWWFAHNEWYVSVIACEVTYEIVSNTDHRHIYMFMCKCMMVTNEVWLLWSMENVWMYAYVV